MKSHRAPSRTAGLGLGLALLLSLSPQPALAVLPDDCGASAFTPTRPQEIIARGETLCTTPRLMRLTVKLQRLVEGVWRSRAISIGESAQPITTLKVIASSSCETGKYRTRVVV